MTTLSAWAKLRNREISCDQALKLLIDEEGTVNLTLVDPEVSRRFFREFSDRQKSPPIIPLLLWQNCYYLGCPTVLSSDVVQHISDRTFTNIKVIPISDKSYRTWYHTQNHNPNQITASPLLNPLTGEEEQENISETTEIYLSKAVDQIGRIKTLISGALRNRASDIHLEPTPEGLRVRYRIDGVLRDITMLPSELGRRVIVALKVMADLTSSRRVTRGIPKNPEARW
ncbi:MAG: ATPase, T2SS/T4P/T4SS family [Chroococcales cyanobacterium]